MPYSIYLENIVSIEFLSKFAILALLASKVLLGIGRSKGVAGMRAPGSKFFHFHAVSAKRSQNNPSLGVGAPSGKSWIRHCSVMTK